MTERDGRTPDEFAHLFRPDSESVETPVEMPDENRQHDSRDEPDSLPDPLSDWEPLVAVPQAVVDPTPLGGMRLEDPPLPTASPSRDEIEADEVEVEVDSEEPVIPPDPKVGRLFRSRGAPERADAITAIGSMQARRLRSMARTDEPEAAVAPAAVVEELVPQPAPILPVASSGEPAPALAVMAGAALTDSERAVNSDARSKRDERRAQRDQRSGQQQRPGSGSLTGLGVYAVTIGVTVILAFGETLFFGGEPGIITGIGLLIVSIFAAFAVRTNDGIHAIFAPPIAFLIASLTAGQVGVNEAGLTGRAVVVFFLLGGNWIWIVGSTAAALVIVALRRRVG